MPRGTEPAVYFGPVPSTACLQRMRKSSASGESAVVGAPGGRIAEQWLESAILVAPTFYIFDRGERYDGDAILQKRAGSTRVPPPTH